MLEKAQQLFKSYGLLVAVCGAIFTFLMMSKDLDSIKAETSDHSKTFEQVQQIALDLKDPSQQLRTWLVNQGVDTAQARIWSQFPKGVIPDKNGKPMKNVPFLRQLRMMDLGILQMYTDDTTIIIIDTLWDYTNGEKE